MEWVHGVMGVLTGLKAGVSKSDVCCITPTVDGSEILQQMKLVVYPCLSHYSRGFVHARWLFGISELSTVCFLIVLKDMPANHVDTVSCKDDFAADVAKLKEEETTSVKQFEAGQLEGIFFWRSTRWVQTKLNLLTIVGSQTMCFLSIFFPDL